MRLSIKEAAQQVAMSSHTLRFYEKEGLMPGLERDTNGNRIFGNHDIEWLNLIRCLRDTGMSIKEMKHFVDLSQSGDYTIPERLNILYNHRENLEVKLEEMQTYMRNIEHKINYYETYQKTKL